MNLCFRIKLSSGDCLLTLPVLLFDVNEQPSVSVSHAINMKESNKNMRILLKCIKYEDLKFSNCADLKVVALFSGL